MKKYHKLQEVEVDRVEKAVYMLLHASRDSLRNQGVDTTKISFNVTEGHYGEAFGVMRGLEVLGYGYFGADHPASPNECRIQNLKWWFRQITQAVLENEHFGPNHAAGPSANQCNYCLEHFGKDAVRTRGPSTTT